MPANVTNSVTHCMTDGVTGSMTEGVIDGMIDGVADGDTSLRPTKEKFTFALFSKLRYIFDWELLFTVFYGVSPLLLLPELKILSKRKSFLQNYKSKHVQYWTLFVLRWVAE